MADDLSGFTQVNIPSEINMSVEPQPAPQPEQSPGVMGTVADMAKGAVSGAEKAVEGTAHFVGHYGEMLDKHLGPLGNYYIGTGPGGFGIHKKTAQYHNAAENADFSSIEPDVKTTAGKVTEDISRFTVGMLGAGKILKGLGWAGEATKVARGIVAGGVAQGTVYDPYDKGLFDLMESNKYLRDVMPHILATDPNDPDFIARGKKTLEGLVMGTAAEGLLYSLKGAWHYFQGDHAAANVALKEAEKATQVEKPIPATPTQVTENAAKPAEDIPSVPISKEAVETIKSKVKNLADGEDIADAVTGLDFNFDHYSDNNTIKQIINTISDTLDSTITKAKGGEVQSFDDINKAAELMGTNSGNVMNNMAQLFGHAKNLSTTVTASRILLQNMADKIAHLSRKVVGGEDLTGQAELELSKHIHLFSETQAMLKGIQTNIARALNAHKIDVHPGMGGTHAEGISKVLEQHGGVASIRNIAHKIVDSGADYGVISRVGQKSTLRKLIDVHNEFWLNSILYGLRTHGVNIMSTAIKANMMNIERMLGSVVTGDWNGVRRGISQWAAIRMEMREALKAGGRAFKRGDPILDASNRTQDQGLEHAISARGMNETGWVGKIAGDKANAGFNKAVDAIGQGVRLPSRLLATEDEFTKTLSYRTFIRSREMTKALGQGMSHEDAAKYAEDVLHKSFDETGRGIDKEALEWAREATFTTDLRQGTISKWLQDGVTKHPMLRPIMPFVRTPLNLIKDTVQHTPLLQFASKSLREDLAAGGDRAALARGKIMSGVALAVTAYGMASEGKVTGPWPKDKKARETLMGAGWKPESYVITHPDGSKTYIPLGRLDPYSMPFLVMGKMFNLKDQMDDNQVEQMASAALLAFTSNMTSKTYLQGLNNFLTVMSTDDPKKIERFMKMQLASYIPNVFKDVNNDGVMRETRDLFDGMTAKVPLMSENLPARRTPLGEIIPNSGGYGIPGLDDANVANTHANYVYSKLFELGSPVGKPPEKVGNTDLTTFKNAKGMTAYDRWLELQSQVKMGGKNIVEELYHVMQSDHFKALPVETGSYQSKAAAFVQHIAGRYRDIAYKMLQKEHFVGPDGKQLGQALMEERRNKKLVPLKGLQALIQ